MRRSLMFLALVSLCTGLAHANTEEAQAGPELDPSIAELITPSNPDGGGKMSLMDPQASDDMKAQAYCYAWTTCPNGRRISCWSRGEYCRWYYRAGREVYCSATSYGRTRWVRYTCYHY